MQIRPATWDDLEPAVELLGARSRAASGIFAIRAEFVRGEWELPAFKVGRDNVVAEAGGRVVGYAAVTPKQELALAAADPAVEDALLERMCARARERGLDAIRVTVVSSDDPLAAMVRRHLFLVESETLVMWRRLSGGLAEPGWSAGLAVRTFQPADSQAVHDLLDEAYCAWDRHYLRMAHDDWTRWMTGDVEFDPTVWWLAERDGELVGCALHWSSGWLKDLAVRTSERGRGLGAALVQQGLAEFARRGVVRVGLKVDAGNPTGAVQLYERLGFVTERREAVWALRP
jgi:mycothiol synthase